MTVKRTCRDRQFDAGPRQARWRDAKCACFARQRGTSSTLMALFAGFAMLLAGAAAFTAGLSALADVSTLSTSAALVPLATLAPMTAGTTVVRTSARALSRGLLRGLR